MIGAGAARPRRTLEFVGVACLVVATLSCGRGDDGRGGSGSTLRGPTPDVVERSVLAGEGGDLAAFLAPLDGSAQVDAWRQRQLATLVDGEHLTFATLFLWNVGSADAGIVLEPLSIEVVSTRGAAKSAPLLSRLDEHALRSSALRVRALDAYLGETLHSGMSLEAIVGFPGDVRVDDLTGAALVVGERVIQLSPSRLTRDQLIRAHEEPSRDVILAQLQEDRPDRAVDAENRLHPRPVER